MLSYSLESTIAEKVHAMIQYKELGSHMKDFHDVSFLSHRFDFDGEVLGEAVVKTFRVRHTRMTMQDFDDVVSLATNVVMNDRWRRSLVSHNLIKVNFSSVVSDIDAFVGPVWRAIVRDAIPPKRWDSTRFQWLQ